MKYAVIDLGTNGFRLLIAEIQIDGSFRTIFQDRAVVMMASEGINRIGDTPFAEGLAILQRFKESIDRQKATKIRAIGTAALRTAENGVDFIRAVKSLTNIEIQVIDGNEEARLIHVGVSKSFPFQTDSKDIIMDIGGGSVEFIIADKNKVYWAESFPIGMSVLWRVFKQYDPFDAVAVNKVQVYFDEMLSNLKNATLLHQPQRLVGASGTFDTLEKILTKNPFQGVFNEIPLDGFHTLLQRLLPLNIDERRATGIIPEERVAMINIAMLLIDYVLSTNHLTKLMTSAHAIKHGILIDMAIPADTTAE